MTKYLPSALLWLGLVCGCTTAPMLTPIRSGDAVAIVVTTHLPADRVLAIRNQAMGSDMAAGAGSGAVIGGLWGLACGPFAPLCVPLAATAGLVSGTAVGAAVGLSGALSPEDAARLRSRLGRAQQPHDLLDDLRQAITDRARGRWTLSADPSAARVEIEVQDLVLTSTRDEQIGLLLQVLVTVTPSAQASDAAARHKRYTHVGPTSPLRLWLDERSDWPASVPTRAPPPSRP